MKFKAGSTVYGGSRRRGYLEGWSVSRGTRQASEVTVIILYSKVSSGYAGVFIRTNLSGAKNKGLCISLYAYLTSAEWFTAEITRKHLFICVLRTGFIGTEEKKVQNKRPLPCVLLPGDSHGDTVEGALQTSCKEGTISTSNNTEKNRE